MCSFIYSLSHAVSINAFLCLFAYSWFVYSHDLIRYILSIYILKSTSEDFYRLFLPFKMFWKYVCGFKCDNLSSLCRKYSYNISTCFSKCTNLTGLILNEMKDLQHSEQLDQSAFWKFFKICTLFAGYTKVTMRIWYSEITIYYGYLHPMVLPVEAQTFAFLISDTD